MRPLDDASRSTILTTLRDGQKIAAIKRYRQTTGAGLVEAKAAVEAMARENGIASTSARSMNPIVVVLALLAVALVYLALTRSVPQH